MYWKNPRTVRRRTVRHRRVFDSDGMDIKKTPRTDARHASIVRQGLEWALTYGQRSAAAFLLVRKVPRPVVERIPISMDGRGRTLVVVRQSRRRWEDAYPGRDRRQDDCTGDAARDGPTSGLEGGRSCR